jgi:hypothetical protein
VVTGPGAGGCDGEHRERAHRQDGVAVEGVPEPDLVLVKSGLPLALLVALLNLPPVMPVKQKSSLA